MLLPNYVQLKVDPVKIPLRWLLVISFVLQMVGTTALVGYLSYRSGQQAVENLANQLLRQTSERVSDRLDNYLHTPQHIVSANYVLPEISLFLNQLQFSPTGQVFIIEKSGDLVATSFKAEASGMRLLNGKPTRLSALNSQDLRTQEVTKKLIQKFANLNNLRVPQQLSLTAGGERQFIQITPYQEKYGLDWLVVTTIPESDFMGEIQKNTRTTALLCLLTLSMAIASGLIIANRFTTLITRLNRVSGQLAAGDLTQRLPIDSSIIEVRELGQSFNLMADRLEQSFDRLQNTLEKSEEKFTTIFRACPDAIGITDRSGRFIEVNNRMLELYGFSREEMIGRTALELGLWANLKEREQFRHLLATQGSAHNIEISSQTKTGEIKTLLLAAEECDLQGQNAVIVIVRDISDRARLEAALRQSEAKFQELAAASPAIIFSLRVDAEGRFQYEYFNRAAELIHEVPLSELLRDGSLAPNQTHPDDLAQFQQAVAYSLKTMQPFENERRIITPSGKVRWLSVSARCQRRETGEVVWHGIAIDITDRKQAEIALLQSELKFATMFLDSPQPAWIATLAEGRCLDVNDSFTLVLGYSRIQAIGKTCVEMQLWTDLADLQHFRASLLQYGRIDNFEIRFRTKSGEIKTVLLSARISHLDEQDCVIGVLNDISDRKAAEIALERYERIVSATTDGIALIDRNYCYQIVNQTYLNWQNKSRSEIIGHTIGEIMGQQVFQTVIKPRLDRCFNGETIEFTGWFTLAGIGQQFLSASYIPYREADGSISNVLASVRNITPLKEAEFALRQSEQKFRGAFDTISAGMALVSPTGGFLEVNAAICQMLSYSEEELLQLRLEDIEHPDDRQADTDWIERIFSGEISAYQIEKRFVSKQGQIIWGLMNLALMRDVQDLPLYLIVQIANISDRRQLEVMKEEFVSIVSHELRTPLTSLRGSLGILESGVLKNKPEKAQQMLQVAVKNTDRLVRLVNDILDLQRLESGKVSLVKEVCLVSDLIEQAVESVKAIAHQANITLEWTHVSASVSASGDEIIQTLINLLGNAIKFSPPHSTIWLKAEVTNNLDRRICQQFPDCKDSITTSYILFSITDRGRGIPADKLETIFGRFQQVDSSDSRSKGGTGLGLAICQNIVQRHQGQIWAESVMGEGSTFYFTLPMGD
ncbi:PAS domain S-box protein [Phormidium sp. LEGE 05292]|uniref:PAS domain S-box protein n=1 Tax=[Phormidium] sp. LEGE 05292 TaxID=767427 RepID=UPI00187E4C87|nr:PAS domain S-box protein [Phormidium sp. LEGE 05292]MBE9226418.1 PAS domain S-box protein [Phormidium sp. LEGE 05292]